MDQSGNVEMVQLMIGGMTCGSCVTLIEKSLKRKQGVNGVSVAFSTGIGVVEYDPFVTSPRDIIAAVDALGEFKATLAEEDTNKVKRLRYEKEIKKWLETFVICLILAVPTLVLNFALDKGCGQMIITDGLSVLNLLLWIFSTIVMVFAGQLFFVSAYKALSHCNTNMDVLITLATSITYFYSVSTSFSS
jgi:Cu+-exporting ATPase